MNETIHIDCDCGSAEHILRFNWATEEGELYTEVQLVNYRNIFQRIWVAIKYVLGYKCRYGHWDSTIMDSVKVQQLHQFLGEALIALAEYRKKRYGS